MILDLWKFVRRNLFKFLNLNANHCRYRRRGKKKSSLEYARKLVKKFSFCFLFFSLQTFSTTPPSVRRRYLNSIGVKWNIWVGGYKSNLTVYVQNSIAFYLLVSREHLKRIYWFGIDEYFQSILQFINLRWLTWRSSYEQIFLNSVSRVWIELALG